MQLMHREDAIYARQSAFRADSISIESQIELCEYETKGSPYRVYTDRGYSGKNTDRPQFQEMLEAIKRKEIKRVICYRLDRCSRSVLDFVSMMEVLQQYDVEFISCTEKMDTSTPMGRSMLNICIIFAQLERETIQMRCMDTYRSMSRKGFYLGGHRPYGFDLEPYDIDGKRTSRYVENTEEAEIVRRIYSIFHVPEATTGDVIRQLVSEGIQNKASKDGAWSTTRIRTLLMSPIYVQADRSVYDFYKECGTLIHNSPEDFVGTNGCYLYCDKEHPQKSVRLKGHHLVLAPHKGLIPSHIWLQCRKKIQYSAEELRRAQVKCTWLAGKLKCAKCGYALLPRSAHKRQWTFYRCSREASAGHYCEGIGKIKLDDMEKIVLIQMRKKASEIPVLLQNNAAHTDPRLSEAENELNRIQNEMEGLICKLASANDVLQRYINQRVSALTIRRNDLEQTYRELSNQTSAFSEEMHSISNWMSRWSALSFEDRRKIIDVMIQKISVDESKISIEWNF